MSPWAQNILAAAVGVVPTVELAFVLPLAPSMRRMGSLSGKSMAVIRNASISDHWKARILPSYAWNLLRTSVWVLILLILLAGVFAVGLYAGAWLFADEFEGFVVLKRTEYQVCSGVIAMTYILCRRSFARVRLFQT